MVTGDVNIGRQYVFYDKNGNIVGVIGGVNDSEHSLPVKGEWVDSTFTEIIDQNTLIFRMTDVVYDMDSGVCKKIEKQKSLNQPAKYLYKITYLGNGKFSEPVVLSTISPTEYENQANLDCSKCLNSGSDYCPRNYWWM